MLINFFFTLKDERIPVSIKEFLLLLEALKKQVISESIDSFYYLSRTILVKDEMSFDKFDRAFNNFFHGIQNYFSKKDIPSDWLSQLLKKELSPEEISKIEKLGYEKLLERLKKLFDEQNSRHEGGNKWIGTNGTSPFGNSGFNPEGIRIGGQGKNRTAVKVWENRIYQDYDSEKELGTRNIKLALRRLRKFIREGINEELALDETIKATANNAGWLDLKMRPERKNNIKVLLLMDVGGTMDDHIIKVEELFSAAKSEFKNMEFFYFHNCIYETLWKNNRRRNSERFSSWEILRKYSPDTRLIFVGDATMSPYEITHPGGSIEYNNKEAGAAWIQRFICQFEKYVWLNPEPRGLWEYRHSISIIKNLMKNKMYPITINGLENAMQILSK